MHIEERVFKILKQCKLLSYMKIHLLIIEFIKLNKQLMRAT
jgi:hypothetical protein